MSISGCQSAAYRRGLSANQSGGRSAAGDGDCAADAGRERRLLPQGGAGEGGVGGGQRLPRRGPSIVRAAVRAVCFHLTQRLLQSADAGPAEYLTEVASIEQVVKE